MPDLGRVILYLICILSTSIQADDTAIKITDLWIRAAPPSSTALAAYLSIKNSSKNPITLANITSTTFFKIEVHKTEIDKQGMMRMSRQKKVEIIAGNTFHFKPGGFHLMLFKPKRALKEYENVMLNFQFSDGIEMQINAEVRRQASDSNHQHHNH